jgi:ABC-type branched-subunit amino acid transport system substrate-binding protein
MNDATTRRQHRTVMLLGSLLGTVLWVLLGWLATSDTMAQPAQPAQQAQHARPATPGVAADSVLFGQSAKMSGSAGTIAGRQYRDGLALAFDAANRSGGVHGRRIELLTLDDQNDGAKALANTRTFIEDKRVFALTGYTFTGSVQAALPLLRAHGVPLVGAYTGTPELYDDSQPTVFSLRASFADELAAIVRHIDTIGYTRVALVHYTTRLGTELREDVAQRLKHIGRDLVSSGRMQINAADPLAASRSAVQPLIEHCPQLVIFGVSGRDAAGVVEAMAASRCPPARFIGRNIVDVGQLQQTLGQGARGVIVTQVVPSPFRGVHPLVSDYRALLRKRDPQARPDFAEFEGYIAGRVVLLALQRAGRDLDRGGFVKAMEGVYLEGPDHFRIQFGSGHRAGSRYTNIVMVSDKERITD